MKDTNVYETESSKLSVECLYTIGGYATYLFEVKSDGFQGNCNFCISTELVRHILDKIEEILDNLSGAIFIEDGESDAFVKFEIQNNRSVLVSGQIGGSHENHYMKFEFIADQTIFIGLKRNLQYK